MVRATIIFFDALSYAASLFLLSVGLTVVFGVLRILNVSHGGIYALGAYMGTWLALWALELGLPPYMTYPALFLGALIVSLTGWFSSHFVGSGGAKIEIIEYRSSRR